MQHFISSIGPYVPLLVFLNAVLTQAGVPVPALPTLLTAGALAGPDPADLVEVTLAGAVGALLGDLVPYGFGRRYGKRVLGWICRLSFSPDSCVRQTEMTFEKFGVWSLLFVKFVPGLSLISVAMAGITRIAALLFLSFDWVGALLFVGTTVVAGHIFRDAIGNALATLAELGKFGILVVIAALALYLAAKWWRRQAFIRQLRMDRITVTELRRLIDDGGNPVIVDVRSSVARGNGGVIPGAIAALPTDVAARMADIPVAQEIIIYCACPNEESAAVAAKHLKAAGFAKIRPLLGGIDAWTAAGYPLDP